MYHRTPLLTTMADDERESPARVGLRDVLAGPLVESAAILLRWAS